MYDYKAKSENTKLLNNYMYAKTLSMFEWSNLPDTLPQRELEKLLQQNGYAFITKFENELYAFQGSFSGKCDAYGNQLQIVISNPHLGFNATLDIEKDGVLIFNDDMRMGLEGFYTKQNTLLVENDINMVVWGYNSRSQNLISAPDDKSKDSANAYLKNLVAGDIAAVGENTLFDGIRVHSGNTGSGASVKNMLEYNQYIKSALYNEVGLSSNFNMKKERLISSELDQAEDSLFPLVYNMMKCRIDAVEKLNEMYALGLEVDFGSVWHFKNKQLVDGVQNDDESQSEIFPVDLGIVENDSTRDIETQKQGKEKEIEQEQEQEQDRGISPDVEPDLEQSENDDLEVDESELEKTDVDVIELENTDESDLEVDETELENDDALEDDETKKGN